MKPSLPRTFSHFININIIVILIFMVVLVVFVYGGIYLKEPRP